MKKILLLLSFIVSSNLAFCQVSPISVAIAVTGSTEIKLTISPTDANDTGVGYIVTYYPSGDPSSTLIQTAATNGVANLVFSNLQPNTTYTFDVVNVDNLTTPVTITMAVPVFGTTWVAPPVPPSNLRVEYNCPNGIAIGWDQNGNASQVDNFRLMFSPDNSNYFHVGSTSTWGRRLSMYELKQFHGTVVYFKVVASNANETQLAWSNAIPVVWNGYKNPPDPINVHSIKSERTDKSLKLSWQKPSVDLDCRTNIITTTYIFYKLASETEFKQWPDILNGEATSVVLDGFMPNDVVDFRVMYLSDQFLQSNRVPNNITMGRDTTLGPPTPLSDLTVTPKVDASGNDYFQLNWKDHSNIEDYFQIELSKQDQTNYKQIAKIKFDYTTFNHTPVEEGVTYFYRMLTGNNVYGNSKYVDALPITYAYSKVPENPSELKAKRQASAVNLTWVDNTLREQNFIIERSTDGSTFTALATVNRNELSYSDGTATANQMYYYRVKAVNPVGSSLYSNLAKVTSTSTSSSLNNDDITTIYPNPTFESIRVNIPDEMENKTITISVTNAENNTVFSKVYKNASNGIEISNLPSGILILNISSEDNSISRKIIKF